MHNINIKQQLLKGRYFPLIWLAAVYLVVSAATRIVLFVHSLPELETPWTSFPAIMAIGSLYDFVTCFYLFALYALYLLLLPNKLYVTRAHQVFIIAASFIVLFGLLYLGPVEYFFFDEFDARFNFVAVSYLIYPHEVFIDIWDSYPVVRVLLAVVIVALAVFWFLRRPLLESLKTSSRIRERVKPFAVFFAGLLLVIFSVDITTGQYSQNRVANELAGNGIYAFFYALFHNELDYDHYYLTLKDDEAITRLRKLVAQPNARFIPNASNPIARHISNAGVPRKLHVVVLIQESLGADFVGAYGDKRGLTPNLDRLAGESLVFTNMYATGTRTVRGLEAISASFPPIPGESIVKRPHSTRIFTWGEIMANQGYTPTFLYGGYGSFDGMSRFFGGNGFQVIDRSDIDSPAFTNIWGVSDEDLFQQAIKVFDAQHARGEKIFSLIMSTSNHKPFTYPAGIAGVLPEGGGRESGVRYADYAIGRFFEMLKTRPYFADTLVVVVGDHGARVYGREQIPMRSYELPLLIYAPKYLQPRKVATLASQIDIAPTVLGLLGISYDTVFFGRDIFSGDAREKFALLSHNRDVALYQGNKMVVLGIRKAHNTYRYDKTSNQQEILPDDPDLTSNAISIFQEGFDLFKAQQYRLK